MPGRTIVPAALAVILLAGLPAATPTVLAAAPSPAGTLEPGVDANGPFRLDLARPSDYVAQANFVQCVGASVQMMLNIVRPAADRTARTQRHLQAYVAVPVAAVGRQFVRRRSQGPWRGLTPAWLRDRWVLVIPVGPVGSGPGARQTALPA